MNLSILIKPVQYAQPILFPNSFRPSNLECFEL